MKKHTSKIDSWFIWLVILVFVLTALLLAYEKMWGGVLAMLSVLCSVLAMLPMVRYYIGNKTLILKTAFYRKEVEVSSIRKITALKNILSTPFATSFDRLEIFYNKYDSVIVSPKDKEVFIKDLLGINAEIEVKM